MTVHVGYRGRYVVIPPTKDEVDEWENILKNSRDLIYNHILARIPDESAFRSKIADTANLAWSDFVNPNWENADFIKLKHKAKLYLAYPDWKRGIENAFGSSGYFPDRVSGKKLKWLKARLTLGSTGLRYKVGRGIAVKAIGVISGMKRVLHDIATSDRVVTIHTYDPDTGEETDETITIPKDDFQGDIVNVFLQGASRFVRPQAIAIITQGLVYAGLADAQGLAGVRDAFIATTNSYLENTVLKQVNTSNYTLFMGVKYLDSEGRIVVCVEANDAGASSPEFCTELS